MVQTKGEKLKPVLLYIGEEVRNRRGESGLSKYRLARKCKMQVTQITNIEEGKTDICMSTLCRIADVLNFNIKIESNDGTDN